MVELGNDAALEERGLASVDEEPSARRERAARTGAQPYRERVTIICEGRLEQKCASTAFQLGGPGRKASGHGKDVAGGDNPDRAAGTELCQGIECGCTVAVGEQVGVIDEDERWVR